MKSFSAIPLSLLSLGLCTTLAAKPQTVTLQSFEDSAVPEWVQANSESHLSISQEKFQHGNHSLSWEWNQSGAILLNESTPGMEDPRELRVWVYASEPGGELEILAGQTADICRPNPTGLRSTYQLNFTGWRSLWIKLREDSTWVENGEEAELENSLFQIEGICIRTKGTSNGRLLLDKLEVSAHPIPHGRLGSFQQPWVTNSPSNRHNFPWIALQHMPDEQALAQFDYSPQELELIEARLVRFFEDGIHNPGKALAGYREVSEKVTINDEGIAEGPAIYSHIVERYYRQSGYPGIHSQRINGALAYCAAKYLETKDEAWKNRYIAYLDYHHEKGYAAGSAVMNQVFEAKNAYNYVDSLLKMKPYLDVERMRRGAENIRWISGINNLYDPAIQPVDADKVLGDLITMLAAIYLQPAETPGEKRQKMYDLIQFGKLVDLTMKPQAPSPERDYTIVMPDYTIFHHDMEMLFSYGYAAADRYLKYYYILNDTAAALNETTASGVVESYAKLFTQKGAGPYSGVRGLSPGSIGTYKSILFHAAYSDLEIAQSILKAYLATGTIRLNECPPYLHDKVKNSVESSSIPAYPVLQGTHVQPYAALLTHHSTEYMVAMRGINRTVPSCEIFPNMTKGNAANIYGQQQGQGFLQLIQNDGMEASGLNLKAGGWDWSLYPGATTIHFPIDIIRQKLPHGKVRFTSRETLSGGLSFFDQSGLFYQELYGEPKHALKDLRGNKSWFFFDDLIVCLGSNLTVSGVDYPMVTNLFQFHHNSENQQLPLQIHQKSQSRAYDQDVDAEFINNDRITLIDPAGHAYFLEDRHQIELSRGINQSRAPFNRNVESSGYTSIANLNHGMNPTDASYEYAILLNGVGNNFESYRKESAYEVLQKDSAAHIVRHLPSGKTGYVILQADTRLENGPVLHSKDQVLLMTKEVENALQLSISDPRLNVDIASAEATPADRSNQHRLLLEGQWNHVEGAPSNANLRIISAGDNTQLEISCLDGESYNLTLSYSEAKPAPKAHSKPAPKAQSKPAPKAQSKPDSKPEPEAKGPFKRFFEKLFGSGDE